MKILGFDLGHADFGQAWGLGLVILDAYVWFGYEDHKRLLVLRWGHYGLCKNYILRKRLHA